MPDFIDPRDFNERNNIGKVGIGQDPDDTDVIVATVVTHNEKDGTTTQKEQRLSKSYLQEVYNATCQDLNEMETMATACGIELDTTQRVK